MSWTVHVHRARTHTREACCAERAQALARRSDASDGAPLQPPASPLRALCRWLRLRAPARRRGCVDTDPPTDRRRVRAVADRRVRAHTSQAFLRPQLSPAMPPKAGGNGIGVVMAAVRPHPSPARARAARAPPTVASVSPLTLPSTPSLSKNLRPTGVRRSPRSPRRAPVGLLAPLNGRRRSQIPRKGRR